VKSSVLRNMAVCERDAGRLHESGCKKRMKKKEQYLLDIQSSTDNKGLSQRLVLPTRLLANRDCLLKLCMLVKSVRTDCRELHMEERVCIGLTSYGYLSVLRQYFVVQNLSSCCSPSGYSMRIKTKYFVLLGK